MVIDRYTKAVLTVIAGCLLFQCAMTVGATITGAITSGTVVEARQQAWSPWPAGTQQPPPQPVIIVGWGEMSENGRVSVVMHQDAKGSVTTDPRLPVRLPYTKDSPLSVAVEAAPPMKVAYSPNQPMPVVINGIRNSSGEWEPIRAQVEPQPMGVTPGQPRQ